jgi:hypothetical protein
MAFLKSPLFEIEEIEEIRRNCQAGRRVCEEIEEIAKMARILERTSYKPDQEQGVLRELVYKLSAEIEYFSNAPSSSSAKCGALKNRFSLETNKIKLKLKKIILLYFNNFFFSQRVHLPPAADQRPEPRVLRKPGPLPALPAAVCHQV